MRGVRLEGMIFVFGLALQWLSFIGVNQPRFKRSKLRYLFIQGDQLPKCEDAAVPRALIAVLLAKSVVFAEGVSVIWSSLCLSLPGAAEAYPQAGSGNAFPIRHHAVLQWHTRKPHHISCREAVAYANESVVCSLSTQQPVQLGKGG